MTYMARVFQEALPRDEASMTSKAQFLVDPRQM
jgi:hypothetical protein